MACAVIDEMENSKLLENATKVGDYFMDGLRKLAGKHKIIVDVRGKGMIFAAELNSATLAKQTVAAMLERHILINCTSETVLRFLPPYIIGTEHADQALAALDEIFTTFEAAPAAAVTAGGHRG